MNMNVEELKDLLKEHLRIECVHPKIDVGYFDKFYEVDPHNLTVRLYWDNEILTEYTSE